MEKEVIFSDAAPRAVGPYSQAIQSGDLIFVSGQIPIDPATGALITGNIEDATHRVLDNLAAILKEAGSSLNDVVKTTIYLIDLADFSRVNAVYAGYFPNAPPARATVQVAALPLGAAVEIDAIARKRREP